MLVNINVASDSACTHFYYEHELVSTEDLPAGLRDQLLNAFGRCHTAGITDLSGSCTWRSSDALSVAAAPRHMLRTNLLVKSINTAFYTPFEAYASSKKVVEPMLDALALYVWYRHSESQLTSSRDSVRICQICRNAETGDSSGPQPNMSPGTVYRYARGCTNPNCFSHVLERAIDPEYTKPEPDPIYKLRERVAKQKLSTYQGATDKLHQYVEGKE